MAILDRLNYFNHSTDAVVTPGASGYCANSIDCGTRGHGALAGNTYFNARIAEAVTGATTVIVELINADDGALSTNATVIASKTVDTADCTVGKVISGIIPPFNKRYLGMRVNCTGTLTAGSVDVAYHSDNPGYNGDID